MILLSSACLPERLLVLGGALGLLWAEKNLLVCHRSVTHARRESQAARVRRCTSHRRTEKKNESKNDEFSCRGTAGTTFLWDGRQTRAGRYAIRSVSDRSSTSEGMASSGERAVSEDDAGAEPPSSLLGWEEADRADAARIEEIAAYVAFLRRSSSTVLAAEEASEGPIATSAASRTFRLLFMRVCMWF